MSAAALLLQPGYEPVPGYVLLARLGGGGFGEVWKTRGPGRIEVALKFIKLESNAGASEQRALEIIRAIRHPNLLTPTAAWTVHNYLVLAMELADGTLWDRLREVRQQGQPGIPREELHEYMHATACALDHLNQRKHKLGHKEFVGVQHRDVKPQNIMLVGGGIRVADFGLARVLEGTHGGHSGGMTVEYAAPEFFRSQTSEHSDQYSLAVTYFELCTGRLPYEGSSAFSIMQQHLHAAPDLSWLSAEERPIVAKALAKEPTERWPSCRAFVEALHANQRLAARPALAQTLQISGYDWQYTSPSMGTQFVLIQPGSFLRGSRDSDREADADERPQRAIQMTRPFYLGKYEVTRGQFRRFVEETGYRTDAEEDGKGSCMFDAETGGFERNPKYNWRNVGFEQTDEHPVVNVTWDDALRFCQWLANKDGRPYTLPTEAQWEFACRAGTKTRYCSGDNPQSLAMVGNIADGTAKKKFPNWSWAIKAEDGYVFTAPVGQFDPNSWGLYDMHGNVWEWCLDAYEKDFYKTSSDKDPHNVNPLILQSNTKRVLRGGSWLNFAGSCRSAKRNCVARDYRSNYIGFRVSFALE